jgi:hypothetical protein
LHLLRPVAAKNIPPNVMVAMGIQDLEGSRLEVVAIV